MKSISSYVQDFLWRMGLGIHNPIRNECTPDFNCCYKFRGIGVTCPACGLGYARDPGDPDLESCIDCMYKDVELRDLSKSQRFNLLGPKQ